MIEEYTSHTEDAISKVSEYNEEYETFLNWLDQAESDFEEFTDEEKKAFADAFEQFIDYTEEPIKPSNVVSVREKMREVLREPLIQAILDKISEIAGLIDLKLDENIVASFENEMKSWPRSKLLEQRTAFEKIESLLEELSNSEQRYIHDVIERKPHQLLEPSDTVIPVIESVNEKGSRLREISSILSSYGWLELEQHDIGPFYRSWLNSEIPQSSEIETVMDDIDTSVNKLLELELPADSLVSKELNELIDNPQENLLSRISEIANQLEKPAGKTQYLAEIPNLIEYVDDGLEYLEVELLNEIQDHEESADPETIDELIDIVEDSAKMYKEWCKNLKARWETFCAAINVLNNKEQIQINGEILDDSDFKEELLDNPINGVQSFEKLVSKLDDLRQKAGGEGELSEDTIELLFDLVENQKVAYSNYAQGTFESLDQVIELEVRINE
jgi:hypothetical protein